MHINRIVEGEECKIMVPFEMNKDISEMHNKLVDCIDDHILDLVPHDLQQKLNAGEFTNAKKKAIHYALDILKESEMEYTACMEDTMCFLYDEIENIDSDDKWDRCTKYYKVIGTKAQQAMTTEFLSNNHIMFDITSDPLVHTIEEAVDNALERGVIRNDSEGIKNDVYNQLYGAINESDILDDMVDDYMIKNSI